MAAQSHTPDHVVMPTYICSCTIEFSGKVAKIVYCPRHKAAPDLLQAVKAMHKHFITEAEHIGEREEALEEISMAAIAKAEGE